MQERLCLGFGGKAHRTRGKMNGGVWFITTCNLSVHQKVGAGGVQRLALLLFL